jgi:DsbC/DsbD-like thiol-disulfide interchange protein
MRRVSVVILNFTAFWLVVTVVAFVLGHWVAGAISFVMMILGFAGLRYYWRNPPHRGRRPTRIATDPNESFPRSERDPRG